MVETADTVLIREVSLIQSVLYREVPLYMHMCVYFYSGIQPCSPRGTVMTVLVAGTEFPEPLTVTIARLYSRFASRPCMVMEVVLVVPVNAVPADVTPSSSTE